MENSCTHGFHTRLSDKITALTDGLCLFIQESTGSPTLLLPTADAQVNRNVRKEMVHWQTGGQAGCSRGAELLDEGERAAIREEMGQIKRDRRVLEATAPLVHAGDGH